MPPYNLMRLPWAPTLLDRLKRVGRTDLVGFGYPMN